MHSSDVMNTQSLYRINHFQYSISCCQAAQLPGVGWLYTLAGEGQWRTKLSIWSPKWHGHWDYITYWNSTEGGRGWSKVTHEISKGLKEQRRFRLEQKSSLKTGLRVEKAHMTSLCTEKHVETNNSSHLFLVNWVNSSVRHTGPTQPRGHSCCVLLQ